MNIKSPKKLNGADRVHILIFEDNAADVALARSRLEDAGFAIDCDVASKAPKFKAMVGSRAYDAILCDYQIPGWSGREALRLVRATDKQTPFIFVSGVLGEEAAVECIREGANDYVVKGNLERLPIALRRALADRAIHDLNVRLVQRVAEGAFELEQSNHLLRTEVAAHEEVTIELRQARKLDALGRLAAGIAHDFNNLLAIILAQSELLLGEPRDATSVHRLEAIRDSGNRAAALTRQLLAFGRRQVLETQILNLNLVLADVEKLLQLGIGPHIQLEIHTEPQLGSIDADPGQLSQVILNLGLNARDAMPMGGKLTIATANLSLDATLVDHLVAIPPGRYVQVVVSDSGCGMSEETQSRIFEPFFTTKTKEKGTGLGLSTVYGIVRQSGGHTRVSSQLGRGTTFTLYFPMVALAAEVLPTIESGKPSLMRGSETILLVDDDARLRDVTCDFLQMAGYTVISAESPDQALQLDKATPAQSISF